MKAKVTTFEQAVRQSQPPVNDAYRPGLQALGRHSGKVRCRQQRRLTGSVNLEDALSRAFPNENLWDYGIGYRQNSSEVALWLEVHPADTSEVETVLKKLQWLKDWLTHYADALRALTDRGSSPYWWLATDAGVHIRPGRGAGTAVATVGTARPSTLLGTVLTCSGSSGIAMAALGCESGRTRRCGQ